MTEFEINIIQRYPNVMFVTETSTDYRILRFKIDTQLEYDYYIWINKELVSISIGAKLRDYSDDLYFWYYPQYYEKKDLIDRIDAEKFIFETLDILIAKKTRIVQKRGLFNISFSLNYLKDSNWIQLYKHYSFRFSNIKTPKIKSRIKIYE